MLDKYLENEKISPRSRLLLRAAQKMGVKTEIVSYDFRIIKWTWKGKSKYLLRERVPMNQRPASQFTQHKEMTKLILRRDGLSVPDGIYATSVAEAKKKMKAEKIAFPVVVKPLDASKGIGVTVGVKNWKEFAKAVNRINNELASEKMKNSGIFMVEKIVVGQDHRVLVLYDKIIAVAKRVPASVLGDGKSTIEKIIAAFNKKRPPAYHLHVDDQVHEALKQHGYTLKTVLPKGVEVRVKKNANVSSGGQAIDLTDVIAPRFRKIALEAAKSLSLRYAGIDIFVDDITSNDPKQAYNIIEVNSYPDYDIHEKPVVTGKGADITRMIIEGYITH